jgi:hypothetical protein
MSNRKALLVGINRFKNYPTATLNGCVNDAHDMAAVLKDVLGYRDTEITILTDASATKDAIMITLKTMVEDAKGGKLSELIFALSSHGTQLPDASDDESDKADEVFCPHDLAAKGNAWDPDHVISDDELHDLFIQLPKSARLEVFLDTCHSGTGLKNIDPLLLLLPNAPKPRYLPPPSQEAFEEVSKMTPRGLVTNRAPSEKLPGDTCILWAACKADQTSADASFNARANGAFTYHYVKAVREGRGKLSRMQVRDQVRKALKQGKFEQTPQLETDAANRGKRSG